MSYYSPALNASIQVSLRCNERNPVQRNREDRRFLAGATIVNRLGKTNPPFVPANQLIIQALGLCSLHFAPRRRRSGPFTPPQKMLRDAT